MSVTIRPARSSWIESTCYVPAAPSVRDELREVGADGLLVTTLRDGRSYVHAVPSWAPGVLAAVAARGGSVGRTWGRLIRGRGPGARLP